MCKISLAKVLSFIHTIFYCQSSFYRHYIPFLNVGVNYTDTENTHHYLCRCVSYQRVYEQTSGSAEDTVKDTWIGHLLLLLLVYDSLHKQLQDSWGFAQFSTCRPPTISQFSIEQRVTTKCMRLTLAARTPCSWPRSFSHI